MFYDNYLFLNRESPLVSCVKMPVATNVLSYTYINQEQQCIFPLPDFFLFIFLYLTHLNDLDHHILIVHKDNQW